MEDLEDLCTICWETGTRVSPHRPSLMTRLKRFFTRNTTQQLTHRCPSCSFTAHNGCIEEWTRSLHLENNKTRVYDPPNNRYRYVVERRPVPGGIHLTPFPRWNTSVKCPQCTLEVQFDIGMWKHPWDCLQIVLDWKRLWYYDLPRWEYRRVLSVVVAAHTIVPVGFWLSWAVAVLFWPESVPMVHDCAKMVYFVLWGTAVCECGMLYRFRNHGWPIFKNIYMNS